MLAFFIACFTAFAAEVRVLEVRGAIDPGSADYIVEGLRDAERDGAVAVVVRLDTPGGLLESARAIVQAELNAEVPVVVYVSPSGARAASAGLFVTMASHVAAMAPGTNIGAAHPVQLGGGEAPSEAVEAKLLHDTAAWARTVSERRGRNAEWAERAVRESAAATEDEALALRVVDLLAADLDALLVAVDGREVRLDEGRLVTLRTVGVPVVEIPMTLRQQAVHALADPNLVFLLVTLGMFGLYVELMNPGLVVPGAIGVLLLVVAALGLSILPFNAAGLILLLGGAVLLGLEVAVGASGVLALTGVAAIAFGGVLLFDRVPGFDLRVDPRLLAGVAVVGGALAAALAVQVARAHRRTVRTGAEGLVGEVGIVLVGGADAGRVQVLGEDWRAQWAGVLGQGSRVRVAAVRGLVLDVVPIGGEA